MQEQFVYSLNFKLFHIPVQCCVSHDCSYLGLLEFDLKTPTVFYLLVFIIVYDLKHSSVLFCTICITIITFIINAFIYEFDGYPHIIRSVLLFNIVYTIVMICMNIPSYAHTMCSVVYQYFTIAMHIPLLCFVKTLCIPVFILLIGQKTGIYLYEYVYLLFGSTCQQA